MEQEEDTETLAALHQASELIHGLMIDGTLPDDRPVALIGMATHTYRDTEVSESCPLRCLDLSERTYRALQYARKPPATVGDLVEMWRADRLRAIRGIGPRAHGEITTALIFIGVDLCQRHR